MEIKSSQPNILILCISLRQSTIRRNNILSEIEDLKSEISDIKIDLIFFDAIYGKDLLPDFLSLIELNHKITSPHSRPLAVGEIGCLLSHLFLWQRIADGYYQQYDRIIIIEDDVFLVHKQLNLQLHSILNNPADFIFLSGHSHKARSRIQGYISSDKLYFHMIGSHYQYTMACAYSITPERGKKLAIKMLKKMSVADDWSYLISDCKNIPYYYFFEQGGHDDSSIENLRSALTLEHKVNRLKKNSIKIYQDIITYIRITLSFKKASHLSDFIKNKKSNP